MSERPEEGYHFARFKGRSEVVIVEVSYSFGNVQWITRTGSDRTFEADELEWLGVVEMPR